MKQFKLCLLALSLLLVQLLCGCGASPQGAEPVAPGRMLCSVLALTCEVVDEAGLAASTSSGSGVIVKLEGDGAYVLTNYHVIYEAQQNAGGHMTVAPYGQEKGEGLPAAYVWHAAAYDLALLYVPALSERFPSAMSVQMSATVEGTVGKPVYAIGNSQGQGLSVRTGVVSRDIESVLLPVSYQLSDITLDLLRFDAAVNQGDSGGALFSQDGLLLGLINARRLDQGGGYAIPSVMLSAMIDEVLTKDGGRSAADRMAFGATLLEKPVCTAYNADTQTVETSYELVVDQTKAGFAAAAFLQPGDVLLSVRKNQEKAVVLNRTYVWHLFLLSVKEGDSLVWQYQRNGVEQTEAFTVSAAHIETIL